MTFAEGQKTPPLAEAQQVLRQQLGLKPTDSFVRTRTTTDLRGGVHERYAQYYQGVPVENGVYLVHARQGRILSLNGDYEPIGQLNVTAAVPAAQALQQALQAPGAERASERQFPAEQRRSAAAPLVALSKGELVIVSNLTPTLAVETPTLAWKFDVGTAQGENRALCYVDARSGKVLGHLPLSADAAPAQPLAKPLKTTAVVSASADTYWHGTRKMVTDVGPRGYILRSEDASGNWHIWTIGWDNNGSSGNFATALSPSPSTPANPNAYFYDYANSSTHWAQGTLTEEAATDVHWGTQMVEEFYRKLFRRNGYDGNGSPVLNVLKLMPSGYAQWTAPGPASSSLGGTSAVTIKYGSGVTAYTSHTAIDVIGHEYGHGLYWSALGTLTSMGQPGAICEGLSDIWGACLTAFIGEPNQMWSFMGRTYPIYARLLNDPQSSVYAPLPDTYRGTDYQDWPNASGHHNSTIVSHWFYLLSEGGSGVNDVGHAYNITGIGWEAAAEITYMMETNYLTPNSDFKAARRAAISCAWYLYGQGSVYNTVGDAWTAVNVTGYDNDRAAGTDATAAEALYPNPADAFTTLNLWAAPSQPVQASLYNTQGQAVKTVVLDKTSNTVDLRDLLPGLYYLRYAQDGKAQSRMLRIER
jgi:Zn-dependent metalloprotease